MIVQIHVARNLVGILSFLRCGTVLWLHHQSRAQYRFHFIHHLLSRNHRIDRYHRHPNQFMANPKDLCPRHLHQCFHRLRLHRFQGCGPNRGRVAYFKTYWTPFQKDPLTHTSLPAIHHYHDVLHPARIIPIFK